MSKAHDPHWRYIAIRFADPLIASRRAATGRLIRLVKDAWPQSDHPQLTRFEAPHGIAKVHHHRLADMRRRIDAGSDLESLSASGTIKTLTDRLGILADRGEGKAKQKGARSTPVRRAAATGRPSVGAAAPAPGGRARAPGGPAPVPGGRRRRR